MWHTIHMVNAIALIKRINNTPKMHPTTIKTVALIEGE
jgi:hypothetical protein